MKVLLLPCKIRVDRFVPQKGAEAVSFLWEGLVHKFIKNPLDGRLLMTLRTLRPGTFIGLKADNSVFVFRNPNGSNTIAFLLKQNPVFASKIKEVWRVERVDHERTSKIDEVT